jgi:hypothetical protein
MFKRILMVFILAVGVLALRSGEVDAHLAGTVYKPTYRHISSYDCTGTFAQVPSLTQHPALFECVAVVHAFQVICQNPQGKITTPGLPSGPLTVTQFAESLFTEADLTDKTKGKAKKTLMLPDTVLAAGDAFCKERNRNWRAADELVLSADVTIRSFDCADPLDPTCADRIPAFEALLRCSVPLCPNGQPCSIPNNPPPTGTPWDYNCALLAEAHCDQDGGCPIPPVPFP